MTSILYNKLYCNKNLLIGFDGGNLTSDSDLLLLKEFDHKIGFSEIIQKNFKHIDGDTNRIYKIADLIIQRIYMSESRYFTDDNSDDLRFDPVFTNILEKKSLASQPTMSRLKDKLTEETLKIFDNINCELSDKIYAIQKPEHIILDLDSTNLSTYGSQEGAKYNFHYQKNGYHPLLMYDGITGDLLKAELRNGNCYTSSKVVEFVKPYLQRQNEKYPKPLKVIRGDSGFAVPGLYELAEEEGNLYIIRLKLNAVLQRCAKSFADKLLEESRENMIDYRCLYGEFYCNRGNMENFIKECKNGFCFESMSHKEFVANANKLQQLMLAYNLNNWFRRLCFPNKFKKMRIETICNKLFKVASKVVKSSRNIIFKICDSFPYKKVFLDILDNIYVLDI